ncbi:MAG: peptide chain release factor N(5)-glutamine methyltransferase [Polyangiaceae bacterium]|nr:peptide chain release factor N(5)-glutamine methyltransferase [Polyangiaceae bacterium]
MPSVTPINTADYASKYSSKQSSDPSSTNNSGGRQTASSSNASSDASSDASSRWTIRRVLDWVTADFVSRGIESPRLEAELLLSHVLRVDRMRLLLDRDRPLMTEELTAYRGLVSRRRNHEPSAYLLGKREFYGHVFEVNRDVLIPRPDTETLVDVALDRTRDQFMRGRMFDVCTGSGNVAVSFAMERPTWTVMCTDLSRKAIGVASRNSVRIGAAWNTFFGVGDLLGPMLGRVAEHGKADLITANPPYIPTGDVDGLPEGIRNHEPRAALDGGSDGLDLVRKLIEQAPGCLEPDGVLAMEIGCDQGVAVVRELERAGFRQVRLHKDLGKRDRVASGIRPLK